MAFEHSTYPVCPHCGYIDRDAWEINFGPGLEGYCVYDCKSCGKKMHIIRHCAVTYTTSRMAEVSTRSDSK